ncbi:Crp/Fnr family transcriptional regulator [Magnetovibrio sp.]|uniref:Crp/Fnr family transcriptional regulator n=1 Tax=Magnetovibrio sp. TaxID=2024836 RepID=UPI002F924055
MTQVFAQAGIGPRTLDAFEVHIRKRSLAVGEYLIRQGECAPDLYFLTEGLVKMFYITAEGKEFVKSFIAEGQFTGSLSSQVEAGESPFSVACLEPVKVEVLAFDQIKGMIDEDPHLLRFLYEFFFALALKKERREFEFLCLTPEMRYRLFVQDNPHIVQRVTQADIARYLGITPVALSRIRGRARTS